MEPQRDNSALIIIACVLALPILLGLAIGLPALFR